MSLDLLLGQVLGIDKLLKLLPRTLTGGIGLDGELKGLAGLGRLAHSETGETQVIVGIVTGRAELDAFLQTLDCLAKLTLNDLETP